MSTQSSNNNKRIAKNTILLYIRTLVVLLIKLYISRLILKYLGVSDYGIYNVVGAFVAMFSVFNGALTSSIQRFITFTIGENNEVRVKQVFSMSLIILVVLSVILLFIGETIGLWYVNNIMEVPDGRLIATNWVYQFSLFTFVMSVVTIPYSAILTAYENFKIYAYFDILNAILTLLLVLSLPFVVMDGLIYYGLGVLVIAIIIRFLYSIYCSKKYTTGRFIMVRDKQLFKQLFSFSFYSFFGNIGTVIGEGGINIVINLFFGVTLNATRGISTQVSNAVAGLVRSFTTAVSPQITKSYAAGEIDTCSYLVYTSAKMAFLLYSVFIIPVIINIHSLLSMWLTIIPPQTEIFVRLMLIQSLIYVLFNPIETLISATGNIKNYQIGKFIIFISNIILIYIVYKIGFDAYWGIVTQTVVTIVFLIFSMIEMQMKTSLKALEFLRISILPSVTIFIIALVLSLVAYNMLNYLNINTLFDVVICGLTAIIPIFYMGLNKGQRRKILSKIINKINERI